MNSLLQSLFMTRELRLALFNWKYDEESYDAEMEGCIPLQLQRLFYMMQKYPREAASTPGLFKVCAGG